VVKQVMLRDLALPVEYARGLEGMLLKQQENDRLAFDVEISRSWCAPPSSKPRRKRRADKQAEGRRQVTVLRAKANPTHAVTLPLKEKQIKLRARSGSAQGIHGENARSHGGVEGDRQPAELERGKLMGNRRPTGFRVTSAAGRRTVPASKAPA